MLSNVLSKAIKCAIKSYQIYYQICYQMLSNAIRFIDLLLAYILSFIVVFTTINIITCYYDHIYWVTTIYYLDIHYILFISLFIRIIYWTDIALYI